MCQPITTRYNLEARRSSAAKRLLTTQERGTPMTARNNPSTTRTFPLLQGCAIRWHDLLLLLVVLAFGCGRTQPVAASSPTQEGQLTPPKVTAEQKAEARRLLQRITTDIESLRREIKGNDFYFQVALRQCRAGDIEAASRTRDAMQDQLYADLCTNAIAVALAEGGQIDAAIERLRAVGNPASRAKGLAGVARAASEVDGPKLRPLFTDAIAAAGAITKEGARTAVLRDLAVGQAWAGDAEGAQKTAALISASGRRSMALGGIAAARASRGSFDQAVSIAQGIPGKVSQVEVWILIAKTHALAGRGPDATQALAAALKIAGTFRSQDMDPMMLANPDELLAKWTCDIIRLQVAVGESSSAKRLVEECKGQPREAKVVIAYALACVRAGETQSGLESLRAASKLCSAIKDESDRTDAWLRLARVYLAAGDIAGARQAIGQVQAGIAEAAKKDEFWGRRAAGDAAAVLAETDGARSAASLANCPADSMDRLDAWRAIGASRASCRPEWAEFDAIYPPDRPSLERLGYLLGVVETTLGMGPDGIDD